MSQSPDSQDPDGSDLPPPPQAYYARPRATHPQAVWSLVLGVVSLVCCGLFAGIPAVIVGRKAMKEIDRAPAYYEGRGLAQAGNILGGIGSALSVLLIAVVIVSGGFTSSHDSSCFKEKPNGAVRIVPCP